MLHTVIFIGRSGCGKGTQADLLKDYIDRIDHEKSKILYVETGERFRSFIRSPGISSKLASAITEAGGRQPDFLACWMWANILIEEYEEDMHLVFDGAPRSRPEALLLTTAMKFYKREQPTVVHLDVSRKWSEEHLLARGRSDDKTLDKINNRLNYFDEEVVPAIEYFKTDPYYRYIEINGEQTVDKVHADIIRAYEHST